MNRILLFGFISFIGLGFLVPRAEAQKIALSSIKAEALTVRPNLLPNFSFEKAGADGIPEGWVWDKRNTDATCRIAEGVALSGDRGIRVTNGTPFGGDIYGMLWLAEPVHLTPGKTYSMSAWVKSERAGNIGIIGGSNWQYRAYASNNVSQWQRISVTFAANEEDRNFVFRINTESQTKAAYLDDVKLEESSMPTPVAPPGGITRLQLNPTTPETEIQGDGPFRFSFNLMTPRALHVEASATVGAAAHRESLSLKPGAWRIVVGGTSATVSDVPIAGAIQLSEKGAKPAQATTRLQFFSASNALKRLSALRKKIPALKATMDKIRAEGQDISYPLVTYTVLDNFTGYAAEDAKKGEVKRAFMQLRDLEPMSARLKQELSDALSGKKRLPDVPRWSATGRPVIKDGVFVGPTVTLNHPKSVVERPIFFNGYGAFGQCRADIEKFPRYGANIIQIEFGPNGVLPKEGVVSDAPMKDMLKLLDRAKKAGVMINVLISPHYFPDWMLAKYPELKKHRDGFLQYCLHAPEGQELLKRYVKIAIEPLKDHPALHSICLSNEPVNEEEPCEYATHDWHDWLRTRHGDLATLNGRWGTNYAAFDDIPLPDPFGTRPALPVWMDYIRFNQEFFAGWHAMLADAVHSVAPDLPVHAKAMTWTLLSDNQVFYGVDATLFGKFSQINGNDSFNAYNFDQGDFAEGWQVNAMGYDLERSVLDAPVFNSENHVIYDRETRYVPGEHLRAALWQGAVHGLSASTIWVWERSFDPKSDTYGSIMHRPACAEAAGIVNCDLNRASKEMAAIEREPAKALILQSVTAAVWDKGAYGDSMDKIYAALSFTGLKPGFVTERQLESGIVPDAPLLFVPAIRHLSDAAFAGLKNYRGKIVFVGGKDLLANDDYGHPRAETLASDQIEYRYGLTQWKDLWTAIFSHLSGWGVSPEVGLTDDKGAAIWGVDWKTARTEKGVLVNLCDLRQINEKVRLTRDGKTPKAVDVLTGETVTGSFVMKPLEVRLLLLPNRE